MDELILLLQDIETATGRPWWEAGEISDELKALLGPGPNPLETNWSRTNREGRRRWVAQALLQAEGVFEEELIGKGPSDLSLYAVARDFASGVSLEDMAQRIRRDSSEAKAAGTISTLSATLEDYLRAGVPFAEAQRRAIASGALPVPLEGDTLTEIAASWRGKLVGRPLGATLARVDNDELGDLLAAIYAGGMTSVTQTLEQWGVDKRELLSIVTLMGDADVDRALSNYYMGRTQEEMSAELLSRSLVEYQARMDELAGQKGKLPPTLDVQKSAADMRRYLVGRMWHTYEAEDIYGSFTDIERSVVDEMVASEVWGTWNGVLVRDGDLDQYTRDEKELLGVKLSLEDLQRKFGTALLEKGEILSAEDLSGIWELKGSLERLVILNRAVEEGLLSVEALGMVEAADRAAGSGVLWDVYRDSVKTTEQDRWDTVTFHGLVLQALVDKEMALNPLLTPEELVSLRAQYNVRLQTFDTQLEMLSTMNRELGPTGTRAEREKMRAQGDGDLLEAFSYVASDGQTTMEKGEFYRLLAREAQGLSDLDLRDELLAGLDTYWLEYLRQNALSTSIADVVDAEAWIRDGVAALVTEGVDVSDHAFRLLEKDRAIEQATRAVDKERIRAFSPEEQLLFELGIPIEGVGVRADEIFSMSEGETAPAYWGRLESTLRAMARGQKASDPQYKAPLGLDDEKSDFRLNFEAFAPNAVGEIMYTAEGYGVTVGEIARRRKAAQSRVAAGQAIDPEVTRRIAQPTTVDYLDLIAPLIAQLPVAQRSDAEWQAIQDEEGLRAEFLAQLPVGPDGQPLQGQALDEFYASQERASEKQLMGMISKALATEFGRTEDEIARLQQRGSFLDMGAEIEAEGLPPIPVSPPTDVGAEPSTRTTYPTGVPVNEFGQVVEDEDELARKVAQRQRQWIRSAPPQLTGRAPRNWEEWMGRQPASRFRQRPESPPTILPQLATRRVT